MQWAGQHLEGLVGAPLDGSLDKQNVHQYAARLGDSPASPNAFPFSFRVAGMAVNLLTSLHRLVVNGGEQCNNRIITSRIQQDHGQ